MELKKEFEEIVEDAQEAIDEIQHDTRAKRRSIQAWFKDANKAIEKRTTLILFAIILSIVGLYINPTLPNEAPKIVKEVTEVKEIPKVKAGTFYTIDLDKMYAGSSKATSDGFIVYYRDKEKNATMWFTLEEQKDNLKYNKSEYSKYLEEQALLETKEVK